MLALPDLRGIANFCGVFCVFNTVIITKTTIICCLSISMVCEASIYVMGVHKGGWEEVNDDISSSAKF